MSKYAREFNEEQSDSKLTSLPRKKPDIFRFETALSNGGKSRRGSLYNDSNAAVVTPLQTGIPSALRREVDSIDNNEDVAVCDDYSLELNNFTRLINIVLSIIRIQYGFIEGTFTGLITYTSFINSKTVYHGPLTLASLVSIARFGFIMSKLFPLPKSRRLMIILELFIALVGTFTMLMVTIGMHTFTHTFVLLLIARVLIGYSLAIHYKAVPLYYKEIFPFNKQLSGIDMLSTTGYGLALFVYYLIGATNAPWSVGLVIQFSVALLTFSASLSVIPETPNCLIIREKFTKATYLISKLYYTEFDNNQLRVTIYQDLLKESSEKKPNLKNSGTILDIIQEFHGFNIFNHYLPLVFIYTTTSKIALIISILIMVIFTIVIAFSSMRNISKKYQLPMLAFILLLLSAFDNITIKSVCVAMFYMAWGASQNESKQIGVLVSLSAWLVEFTTGYFIQKRLNLAGLYIISMIGCLISFFFRRVTNPVGNHTSQPIDEESTLLSTDVSLIKRQPISNNTVSNLNNNDAPSIAISFTAEGPNT